MQISVKQESFRLAKKFVISRGSRDTAEVVTVTVSHDGHVGQGECLPYQRYNETIESVSQQIQSIRPPISRQELMTELPPGAARNALDCALWDLTAKQTGKPVWQLASLPPPQMVTTAYTISLSSPDEMYAEAAKNSFRPILKIKLGGTRDVERLEAVRHAAPDSQLIIDANESFQIEDLEANMSTFINLGIKLIEQPLPASSDSPLNDFKSPIPICADESCHDVKSLDNLERKYDMINIKLDKSGGLTEAIRLYNEAVKRNFKVMIGCMVGTSLGIAPALTLAVNALVVDLDAPLLLYEDRKHPIRYDKSKIYPAPTALWG